MALLTAASFLSKWQARFPDNTERQITEAAMREFTEDIKDSFQNLLSTPTISSWKTPCLVATTGNITLSGEQTIDGVLTSASRVLVRAQDDSSENGIYVSNSGAWSRASDADTGDKLEGAAVGIQQGTTYADSVWVQTTDDVTLETSDIDWQQIGFGNAPFNFRNEAAILDDDELTLDFGNSEDSAFYYDTEIDSNVDVLIVNDNEAQNIRFFKFSASAGVQLTFESDVRHNVWDGAWNSDTGLIWTAPADGAYIMKASKVDSLWFIESISGPYPTT